jgi:hypothetical protein
MTQSNSMGMPIPPVLFLIFNRPDTTKRVFEEIRKARPQRLYIAGDGPREGVRSDAQLCEASRNVVGEIDWDCHVQTLFREKNYGCKVAPSSAITWFFGYEPEGIILEDDCVPHPTFFRFCSELLDRFRHDERIMMISGSNELGLWKADGQSYHFSTDGVWGWASWRRAWAHFDVEMKRWTDSTTQEILKSTLRERRLLANNLRAFSRVHRKKLDSWAYPWRLARLINGGLTVTPAKNLVSNIGFRADATHTRRRDAAVAALPVHSMEFPLKHNTDVALDQEYVKEAFELSYAPIPQRVRNRLRKLFAHIGKVLPRLVRFG